MTMPVDAIPVGDLGALPHLAAWRFVAGGAATFFATGSVARGAALVAALDDLDDLDDAQRLDVDLRRDGVTVRVITIVPRVFCGLTAADVGLIERIDAAARNLGLAGDPAQVQSVQISIDALDRAAVGPFWQAVLGYVERDGPEDLMDPHGSAPAVFLAEMDVPRPQRNRVHVDIYVPAEQAPVRVAAAIAAGGRLVTDRFAPAWWVLADAEGNEVCVAVIGAEPATPTEES